MPDRVKIRTRHLSFSYRGKSVLQDVNLALPEQRIIAITGPSGIGKSTFLSVFNRLWEESGDGKCDGRVTIRFADGEVEINGQDCRVTELRRRVGMVFQAPNPLPMSVGKNVAFPLILQGGKTRREIADEVEAILKKVHLFEEVKDRLDSDARLLSGGQQQRLCMARALISGPEVLLLDEPTSSLDGRACAKIEELLEELKEKITILMVSHFQEQVRRVADIAYELADRQLQRVS